MGLGDWLDSVGHGIVQTVDHAGNAVGHAVGSVANAGYTFVTGDSAGGRRLENSIDGVSDAIFFDGTVAGTNPAQIYKWFHDGPGTGDYGTAATNCGTLHTNLSQYADHFAKSKAALQEGWTGAAGSIALQNTSTSQPVAEALAERSGTKQSAYGGQIQVFDSTKNSLVKVPDNPPPPNNPMVMDPISTASGAVDAAAYQSGAKNNQQAYTGYQPPTQSHMSTIPQGDTAINTGQTNDSGSTPQQGTGISEPGAYNPSFGQQSPHGRSSTSQQPNNSVQHFTQPNVGPGGTQQGGSTGTPGGAQGAQPPPLPGGDTSTGLAGYQAPPAGSSSFPTPGGYDSSFGPGSGRGGADGGYGSGSVFAGGGFGGSGSGSGVGGSGGSTANGRGGSPGSGPGAGAAGEGMAARSAAGARGAAGQGGAGAPGVGGRGGKKEEDKERKTADYLVTEEHGTEVVGDLPPALPAGGVIG